MLSFVPFDSLGSSSVFQDTFAIFVQFQLHDDNLAWMNTNMHSCSISLFTLDSFDVHDILLSVDLDNFSYLLPFEVTTNNLKVKLRRIEVEVTVNLYQVKSCTKYFISSLYKTLSVNGGGS